MSGQLLTVDFRNRRAVAACSDCRKRPSEPGSAWCRGCDEYRVEAKRMAVRQAFRAAERSREIGLKTERSADCCSACGRGIDPRSFCTYDLTSGGLICRACTLLGTPEPYDVGRSLESAMRDECEACNRPRRKCLCYDTVAP